MIAADATLAGHERQWDARANNEHARRICPLKNCHARQTKALSVLCIGMRVSVLSDRGDKVDFLISTSFTGMFGVNGMEKLSRTSVLGFLLLSCAFSSTSQEPQALPSGTSATKWIFSLLWLIPMMKARPRRISRGRWTNTSAWG